MSQQTLFVDVYKDPHLYEEIGIVHRRIFMERYRRLVVPFLRDMLEKDAIVMAGGALTTLMSNQKQDALQSDIDIFVICGASPTRAASLGRKALNVLTQGQVPMVTVQRGLLIDVMIPCYPPVQLLFSNVDTAEGTLARSDLAHAQCFFDGKTLWMSEFAIMAYRQGTTFPVLPPIKSTRVEKFKSRGMKVVETPYVIQMDKDYHLVVHRLDALHSAMNSWPNVVSRAMGSPQWDTFRTSVDATIVGLNKTALFYWRADRLEKIQLLRILTDMDLLDQAYRLENVSKSQLITYLDGLVMQPTDVPDMFLIGIPCAKPESCVIQPVTTALWLVSDQSIGLSSGPISHHESFNVLTPLSARFNNCAVTWPPHLDTDLVVEHQRKPTARYAVFYLIYDNKRNTLLPTICEYRIHT